MKKYLLFAFDHYYPAGGLDDLKETSDSLETLMSNTSVYDNFDYIVIYDRDTFKAIWTNKHPDRLQEYDVEEVKVV